MQDMVLRFERSGLGRKAFCAAEPINVHTFYYWLDKFKKEKAAPIWQSFFEWAEQQYQNALPKSTFGKALY